MTVVGDYPEPVAAASRERLTGGRLAALSVAGLVAISALAYVKWTPLPAKVAGAVANHSIGSSLLLTGGAKLPPAPSWQAAWSYAQSYYGAVWTAVIAGIVIAGAVQALAPQRFFQRFVADSSIKSTLFAAGSALPTMFCSCCAAPLAVGVRQRRAALAPTLAFAMGAPALNVGTLVLIGVVLGWQLALLRLIFALAAVVGVSMLAARLTGDTVGQVAIQSPAEPAAPAVGVFGWLGRWLQGSLRLAVVLLPLYVVFVLLMGFTRAWLFPLAGTATWGNSLLVLALLAAAGTLFVIPTAGEVPIVQALLAAGLAVGPAAALLVTLPTVSLPQLAMLRTAVPTKALTVVGCSVWVLGIAAGLVAVLLP